MEEDKPTHRIIDGLAVARDIGARTAADVVNLKKKGIVPTLTVVYFCDSPPAESYRKQIHQHASTVGVAVREVVLPTQCDHEATLHALTALNHDDSVHGVLVQTPFSAEQKDAVMDRLSVHKDAEAVTPKRLAELFVGHPVVSPCTPRACMALIQHEIPDLKGVQVAIVNGSPVIGRPLAMLLIDAGATPTICTHHTRNLARETSQADVLVAAAGKPGLIGPQHVHDDMIVIDAAITRLPSGHIVGDVDTAAVRPIVAAISPVPGGVGPVTTATLLSNVVTLAHLRHGHTRAHPLTRIAPEGNVVTAVGQHA